MTDNDKPTTTELVRTMALYFEHGVMSHDLIEEIPRAYPVTMADMQQAWLIAIDRLATQNEQSFGHVRDDLDQIFELMASGAPKAEIDAGMGRLVQQLGRGRAQ